MASLAMVMTRRGEGGAGAEMDTFEEPSRKGGTGGRGFEAAAAAAARRAWAGFSGNPRGRSIVGGEISVMLRYSIIQVVDLIFFETRDVWTWGSR